VGSGGNGLALGWGAFEGLGSLNAVEAFWGVHGLPEVGAALRVEPEVGGVAKDAGKDEGGVGGDGAAVATELVDVLSGEAGFLGEVRLGLLRLLPYSCCRERTARLETLRLRLRLRIIRLFRP
jgi:hypothetical protein